MNGGQEVQGRITDEFDPKIIGSVFFFAPQSAGFGSKEKNGSKRNSPKPAPSVDCS